MTSSIHASRASRRGRYPALALLAGGGLLYEIALTRLLSALYFNSFVYVLLSVAVLGIGLGAALATTIPALRQRARLSLWFALAGLSAAGLVPGLIELSYSGSRFASYTLVAVPYMFTGLALATLFAADAENSPRLYLADLAGAGLGGLLAAPLLNLLGGTGAALAAAVALGAGAPLVAVRVRAGRLSALAPVGAAILLLTYLSAGWPAVDYREIETPKPITEQLAAGGELREWRWDALARTDLVERPDTGARYLYLDGGAGSLVPDPTAADTWARDVGAFAFAAIEPERAFLLGSGGGLDIALALRAGVDTIVAAEVNRASVALSRQLEPGLYDDRVDVRIDEGRSALRREGLFDLVLLSQTVTQNAELHGIALTENALYTVEAFREYLSHLTSGGAVAIKLYDELTLTRAVTTAVAALASAERTPSEATRHLFAVLDTRALLPIPLLLVRENPFTRDEAIAFARTAETLGFGLLFVPGLLEPPPLDALAAGRADLAAIVNGSPDADLSAPRDHRPFFWQFEPGIPRSLRPLLAGLGVVLGLVSLIYLIRLPRLSTATRWGLPTALLLGAGFMLAEIALLQRVQLLVGRPSLALGSALGALLIGAGMGSMVSARWRQSPFRTAALGAAAVVVALVVAELAWPSVIGEFGAYLPAARLLAALVPVAIVALPMGVPFPHLLRGLGRAHPAAIGPAGTVAAAWAVNGFASVCGAVGAAAVAVVYGFPTVAGLAVACYALAAGSALRAGRVVSGPAAKGATMDSVASD